VEDAEHVLLCPNQEAADIWEKSIQDLDKWMQSRDTALNIRTAICAGLRAWRNGTPVLTDGYPEILKQALQQQSRIGWRNLIEGFPAKKWTEAQAQHYIWTKSRRTGRRWAAALVKKLADTAWDMWEHRNSVAHEGDTNVRSNIVNQQISQEFRRGFVALTRRTQRTARLDTLAQLQKKSLNYRQQWLKLIRNDRQYQERLAARQQPPPEIVNAPGPGHIWWIRNGKPTLEEYRAMQEAGSS
jgi:hypothetical protein